MRHESSPLPRHSNFYLFLALANEASVDAGALTLRGEHNRPVFLFFEAFITLALDDQP